MTQALTLVSRFKEKNLLCEWLCLFKENFFQYDEAKSIITNCDTLLEKYNTVVEKIRIPLHIKKARELPCTNFEYGVQHFINSLKSTLKEGCKIDPRFPERSEAWLEKRIKEKQIFTEWIEGFRAQFLGVTEATATITEAENLLAELKQAVDKVRMPIAIQKARDARDGPLTYGLKFHLEAFSKLLETGPPNNQRDSEWLSSCSKHQVLLSEWLCDFRSQYGQEELAKPVLAECEAVEKKYKDVVGKHQLPIKVRPPTPSLAFPELSPLPFFRPFVFLTWKFVPNGKKLPIRLTFFPDSKRQKCSQS